MKAREERDTREEQEREVRAQREREKQVSETKAVEERRELESESTSLSVRFKGDYCEAVMNREIEVRYGQVVVTSEQEPAIWDVVDESATTNRENETTCAERAHGVAEKVLVDRV